MVKSSIFFIEKGVEILRYQPEGEFGVVAAVCLDIPQLFMILITEKNCTKSQ
jgi:hypothetical protein